MGLTSSLSFKLQMSLLLLLLFRVILIQVSKLKTPKLNHFKDSNFRFCLGTGKIELNFMAKERIYATYFPTFNDISVVLTL